MAIRLRCDERRVTFEQGVKFLGNGIYELASIEPPGVGAQVLLGCARRTLMFRTLSEGILRCTPLIRNPEWA